MLSVLLSLVLPAHAGFLDLSTTGSSGCDDQWLNGICLAPDVWGPDDSLGIDTPSTVPVLTMGTDSAIALEQGQFASGPRMLNFLIQGNANSASTKVGVEVRFFDSSNAPIGTQVLPVHSNAAGLFGSHVVLRDIPTAAVGWKARLRVEDDGVAIGEAGTSCWGCGGPGEYPPGTGDGGHTGLPEEEECTPCEYECDGYTIAGEDCGSGCSPTEASCGDGFMNTSSLPIQAGVVM